MFSRMKQHVLLFLYCVLSSTRASDALTASPAPVAVIGTTGRLGRRIVQELSQKGIPSRCLLRHEIAATTSVPVSLDQATSSQEVAAFLQSLPGVTMVPGDIGDTDSLRRLVEGCDACIAAHGPTAPKPFLRSILFPSVLYPDTLPEHPKQINYQGIHNLMQAMEESANCKTIVRITGKGESPWSIFSILINALGGLAKAWNYEGEQLLRRNNQNLNYIIIRPGVMKETIDSTTMNNRGLCDNGQDMKVTPVSYAQIAELAVQTLEYPNCQKATLTAMNVQEGGTFSYAPLLQQVAPDRRAFPDSLLAEHRKAARVGGLVIVAFLLVLAQAAMQLILMMVGKVVN